MAAVDPAPGSPGQAVTPASSAADVAPTDGSAGQGGSRRGTGSSLGVMLVMGILAGVAGGLLTDRAHGFIKHPPEFMTEMKSKGINPPPEYVERFIAADRVLRHKNTALTIGLIGIVFCGFVGLGRGILQRSWRTAALSITGGVVLGLALGSLGGFAESLLDEPLSEFRQLDRMVQGMIKHAVAWSAVGAAVGLTAVVPAQQFGRIAGVTLATVAAGIVAALVFIPIAAILFPDLAAESAVPSGLSNRVLWTSLPAILMSLVVGRSLAAPDR